MCSGTHDATLTIALILRLTHSSFTTTITSATAAAIAVDKLAFLPAALVCERYKEGGCSLIVVHRIYSNWPAGAAVAAGVIVDDVVVVVVFVCERRSVELSEETRGSDFT